MIKDDKHERPKVIKAGDREFILARTPIDAEEGDEVDIVICGSTTLGYRAVINGTHLGILYRNEVFKELHEGDTAKGYIKKIRDDGKIDLTLHRPGFKKVNTLAKIILERLKSEGGFLAVNDKSSPEIIYSLFGESKSTFKTAIGNLYKKRKITIDEDGIRLV